MYKNKDSVIVTLWISIIYLRSLLTEADKELVVQTIIFFLGKTLWGSLCASFHQVKKNVHLLKN